MPISQDPFRDKREESGLQFTDFDGESIPFILRLKDLRKTVKNWQSFSSDHPFQVVPRSEEGFRSIRQVPIEMDPPDHTDFRTLLEPVFKRPNDLAYIAEMEEMVSSMITGLVGSGEIDAVYDLALPLQCRALAKLLQLWDMCT